MNTTWEDDLGGPWMASGLAAYTYGHISCVADGAGTLIMPYGTVENVLRISTSYSDSDVYIGSGYMNYLVEIVDFYKPGVPYPLLSFSRQRAGGSISNDSANFDYGAWLAFATSGVREAVADPIGMDLVPNPAHDATTILYSTTGEALNLSIFDATGRLVRSAILGPQPVGIGRHVVDLSSLAPGLYSVQIATAKGQRGTKLLLVE